MVEEKMDIDLVAIDVGNWRRLAILYPTPATNWRKVAFVVSVCVLLVMQFFDLLRIWEDLPAFLLNLYFFAGILCGMVRTLLVIRNHKEFENFLLFVTHLYRQIEASSDERSQQLLATVKRKARQIAIINLSVAFLDITCTLIFGLFRKERIHPIEVALPLVDMQRSPTYEIVYLLQVPMPVVLSLLYMPFTSLFAAFALFGKAMLQILSYKLTRIVLLPEEEQRYQMLTACIRYYMAVASYVRQLTAVSAYVMATEAIIFVSIIAMQLFCLNIITSPTKRISLVMYILTALFVLYTSYNRANDVVFENECVSQAVYNVPWYECGVRFRKTLLIFLMQTQRPLLIKAGNVYPMTLATFQSLLNTSYSYFTMLRGMTNK
ncbi:odorant receptor 43a [Drosophila grimshawi]|uniref:Odorant receptor n=1 Tax=Drosophila grimshawi TaxID=7222 RepID=B4J409_DROGR|nr:odorant receptor 43a [Drosophila grimshawi]EDW01592.1 GH20371 [Drosophila grimshawi]